jgi:hypothetical protein
MTKEEKEVLELATKLWNALVALPVMHHDDNAEHMRDIHDIQNRVLARSAIRAMDENGRP